jgi:hypothetical protein
MTTLTLSSRPAPDSLISGLRASEYGISVRCFFYPDLCFWLCWSPWPLDPDSTPARSHLPPLRKLCLLLTPFNIAVRLFLKSNATSWSHEKFALNIATMVIAGSTMKVCFITHGVLVSHALVTGQTTDSGYVCEPLACKYSCNKSNITEIPGPLFSIALISVSSF